jgi:VWFA-related protein
MIPRGLILCSAVFLLASTAAPQTQSKPVPLASSIDVRVVNVDVTVTDGNGNPVTNLAKEDFEVLEDGQPQRITNFSLNQKKAAASNTSAEGPPAPRRKVIVVIDNNYIDARQRSLTLDTLDRFVEERFDDNAEWSIATIGQSLDIIQPLTSSRAKIREAVAKARKSGTVSLRTEELDREILSDPFRRTAKGSGYDYEETVRFQGRERTARNERSLANTAKGLTEAARSYSGVDGKKIFVLLTGGMEMNTSFAAYDNNRDHEMNDRKKGIASLIDQIVLEANSGNLAIYVINVRPSDMAAPQHDVENQAWGGRVGASSTGTSDISDVDSAAFTLAASTGGLTFTANAVRKSLDSIDAMTANYYSLGYGPQHAEDGKYHAITVRLNKPGLHALNRRGYLDVSPDVQLEQYLRLRISILQPSNSVAVKVDTQSSFGPDGKPIVQLTGGMPWQQLTLLRTGEQYKGRVHVYLAIFDKNGANVGFHHQIQDVVLTAEQYAQTVKGAFRYRMAVRLEKGEYTVAMTMRDDLSRDVGTGVQRLRL